MPTYVYKCKKCGKIFEYDQRITEEALTHCPKEICEQAERGLGEVERKISSDIGFDFRGSGFYQTDYANSHSSSPSCHKPHITECSTCDQHATCESSK